MNSSKSDLNWEDMNFVHQSDFKIVLGSLLSLQHRIVCLQAWITIFPSFDPIVGHCPLGSNIRDVAWPPKLIDGTLIVCRWSKDSRPEWQCKLEGKQLLVGDQYLAVNTENIRAAARKVRHHERVLVKEQKKKRNLNVINKQDVSYCGILSDLRPLKKIFFGSNAF